MLSCMTTLLLILLQENQSYLQNSTLPSANLLPHLKAANGPLKRMHCLTNPAPIGQCIITLSSLCIRHCRRPTLPSEYSVRRTGKGSTSARQCPGSLLLTRSIRPIVPEDVFKSLSFDGVWSRCGITYDITSPVVWPYFSLYHFFCQQRCRRWYLARCCYTLSLAFPCITLLSFLPSFNDTLFLIFSSAWTLHSFSKSSGCP